MQIRFTFGESFTGFFAVVQEHELKLFFIASSIKAFLSHHKESYKLSKHKWVLMEALFKQQLCIQLETPFL